MKQIIIKFLFLLISALLSVHLHSEAGDFVKDIPIKELKFQIPSVQKDILGNGLIHYHDQFNDFPIAYLEIHFYSGDAATESLPQETSTLFADSFKFGGTENFKDSELLTQFENLGASIGVSTSYEKTTLSVSFLSRDQKKILELLEEMLNRPAFSESALSNGKMKLIDAIKRRNERTESLGFRKVKELVFKSYKKGYSNSIESVSKVSRDSILSFYEIIKKSPRTVVSSGLYDEKLLKDFIIKNLKIETSSKAQPDSIDLDVLKKDFANDPRKEIFIKKDVNQSMLILVGPAPEHSHKDFFAIQLLNYIIGGGGFNSYFMQEIREKRGLAYSATSYPVFEKDHGLLYFYTLTKNETLKEAHTIMKQLLSPEVINKITEKELTDAKNAINNQFVFLFSNRHSILSNQLGFEEDGMPPNYLETYRENIQSVNLNDIRRVGKEYFYKENLKTIIVSSEKNIQKQYPEVKKLYEPEEKLH
ncbi:MAG: pitrilysin family protein [Leptospiraceae bacterium]|nr:pitrilysin family protein [Leptospiraceae bacterium]